MTMGSICPMPPSTGFELAFATCPARIPPAWLAGRQVDRQPVDARTSSGHPKGLLFLSFTEAWERFSFYGMRSLLVQELLLLPGRIEHVAGMGAYRAALESVVGPLST
jgi:hypothetical protein